MMFIKLFNKIGKQRWALTSTTPVMLVTNISDLENLISKNKDKSELEIPLELKFKNTEPKMYFGMKENKNDK